MISRIMPPLSLFVFFMLASSTNAFAQSIDPHRLYEERCARCHAPHAGEFVHNTLALSDGKVIGRETSKGLRAFLDAGHGRLNAQEIDVMVAHLEAIQKSGRLFRNKCIICHDRAVLLARAKLTIRNGRLTGRYSGRDMEDYLTTHGRLKTGEAVKMLKILNRQLEVK